MKACSHVSEICFPGWVPAKRCHTPASGGSLTSLVLGLRVREPRLSSPSGGAVCCVQQGHLEQTPTSPSHCTAALDGSVWHSFVLGLVGVFSELPEVFRAPVICGAAFESFRSLSFYPALAMREGLGSWEQFCSLRVWGYSGSLPPLVSLGRFQHLGAQWVHNPDIFLHKCTKVRVVATSRLGKIFGRLIFLRDRGAWPGIPWERRNTSQTVVVWCGRRSVAFPHLFSREDS